MCLKKNCLSNEYYDTAVLSALQIINGSCQLLCQLDQCENEFTCDHKNVAGTNSTSIKLFSHVQSAVTQQVQTCQTKIRVRVNNFVVIFHLLFTFQNLPIEQNENLCRVCRTFCLACLQNVFPGGKHWGK